MAFGSWLFCACSIWRAASSIFLLAASRPAVSMETLPWGVVTDTLPPAPPRPPIIAPWGMNSEPTAPMTTPITMPATRTTTV